jgi:hypothetical protein
MIGRSMWLVFPAGVQTTVLLYMKFGQTESRSCRRSQEIHLSETPWETSFGVQSIAWRSYP